ncbi:hypothetical protein GCM10022394_19940 [Zobellella aerophila]|uniref:protein O-GlcNAc transferase n=2 Tax=Zobellella aerophila TaxID=870480 RepID=A0ABP6VWC4_9GAMM
MELYTQGYVAEAITYAEQLTIQYPDDAFSWKALGNSLYKAELNLQALDALEKARALAPEDYLIFNSLAKVNQTLGNHPQAIAEQQESIRLNPSYSSAHIALAKMFLDQGNKNKITEHLDEAEKLGHDLAEILSIRVIAESYSFQFHQALNNVRTLLKLKPNEAIVQNHAANIYKDMADFEMAERHYSQALKLDPDYTTAYSGLLYCMHYNPHRTQEQILAFAKQCAGRFTPKENVSLTSSYDLTPNKPLRIGMISSGFKLHPVGQMITPALENLPSDIELYAYSTNDNHDFITGRIKNSVKSWSAIHHLSDKQLAEKIQQDGIDILIDLAGHGDGNRLRTFCMNPAPVNIKWVGGLVNTTGLSAFDYLLSDHIETPSAVDQWYVEKLIRMPDDYICYLPPPYIPDITALPAISNGFITLGCFNNPAKINPILLAQWAKLMHELPNSRLYLKGGQYNSAEVCDRIRNIMQEHRIGADRLILEGPSSHKELLGSYNKVDIALDPWPYSGGLTTCEAMMMGVPVVTLPGPTFAGRHSATHLVNAGMPELVASDWDEYRRRAVELASDWPNLSVIRACLRQILLKSPVCDGPRFAKHFTTAMRAIWQRYCEDKKPAALSIDKNGQAWFEGEERPVKLPALVGGEDSGFNFGFHGQIITLDNGSLMLKAPNFSKLQEGGKFAIIAFDPANNTDNIEALQQQGELYHYPLVTLGNGKETTLYSCLGPAMTATLEPLPTERQLASNEQSTQVTAKQPIGTLRLDDIEGLESIDWLLLDNMNDSLTILENGENALEHTLLVQARVNFTPTHKQQPELTQISHWLARHGFSFYRLNNLEHRSRLPKPDDLLKQQASQLTCADAIFIPNAKRMEELTDNQRLKLAFLLHTVYGVHDLTYSLLSAHTPAMAEQYQAEITPVVNNRAVAANKAVTVPQADMRGNDRAQTSAELIDVNKESSSTEIKKNVTVLKASKNMDTHTRICIGVPIYNEELYIAETLNSLKAQNIDNVHFLVTDNHSTDRTLEICREIIGNDERFTLIQHKQNIGALENFKFAFEASRSDYFMWLGGHDFISGRYIETAIKILDKSPQISMVCGQPHAILNSVDRGVMKEAIYDFTDQNPINRYLQSVGMLSNCTVVHSVFRRSALSNFQFRITISGDHVLISHLLWQGQLRYMEKEKYSRRFFEQRSSTQPERISGDQRYLSRHDFYKYYLDDFASLYHEDERMSRYLEGKILELLDRRWGRQGFIFNDGFQSLAGE